MNENSQACQSQAQTNQRSIERYELAKQSGPPALQDAFPREILATPGCNKREYFAAMALSGLMDWDCQPDPSIAADKAVLYADALIARLGHP